MALPHANAEEFRRAVERMFGADRLAEFLALYAAGSDRPFGACFPFRI
jgi:hypothetical protein